MKRLFSLGIIMILGIISLLSGCSNSSTNKIRVGEVTRSLFYAPQYVALEKGFFTKQGLEVELTTTWGGDKTMTTLLSDGIDVALVGSETSIYVDQQGAQDPVINFAQLTQTDGTFLVARKKTDSFSWDEVKGKTFLGQRKGGMPQMVGEFVLKKNGINPQQDTTLVQNIDFKNIPSAFASGTGDYVQLFEPQASQFEQEGVGQVVASFGKESGRVPYTSYMAKQSYIKNNNDSIQKFTNAIQEGQNWVNSHSAEEVAQVIGKYFTDVKPEILVTSVKRYQEQGSYAKDPLLREEEWILLQEIMKEVGELKQPASYEKLVDQTFAKKAAGGN
ncbi:ABC transporter substrate-binding protein [Brevibacillus daliensis]|uniref:ABC transporter substrate-binding protein n=1 Tax=Brevibacillus daliensis TaxID=2892995 RepID=UPI001E37A807|nr:ABC transporter substrate-binding protein [Brevibacillus daliensis]